MGSFVGIGLYIQQRCPKTVLREIKIMKRAMFIIVLCGQDLEKILDQNILHGFEAQKSG